jgi:hypothetical protein
LAGGRKEERRIVAVHLRLVVVGGGGKAVLVVVAVVAACCHVQQPQCITMLLMHQKSQCPRTVSVDRNASKEDQKHQNQRPFAYNSVCNCIQNDPPSPLFCQQHLYAVILLH